MMIACDVCDNWYHSGGCLSAQAMPQSDDEQFVCPLCVETKAEVYLSEMDGGIASFLT